MNNHPECNRFLHRRDKEKILAQRGIVVWLFGLPGAGKSTIANAAERVLHHQGHFTTILDDEYLRTGLNSNLGFSDHDRLENVRRIAETAKILVAQGVITFVSAITPRGELRDLARGMLDGDLFEVYVKASYAICDKRDSNGSYAKATSGDIQHFTGKDGSFEPPQNPDLVLNTENSSVEDAAIELLEAIRERISPPER